MTREQARKQLEGTWMFKEVNGMIALRDVDLIEAVQAYEERNVLEELGRNLHQPYNGQG